MTLIAGASDIHRPLDRLSDLEPLGHGVDPLHDGVDLLNDGAYLVRLMSRLRIVQREAEVLTRTDHRSFRLPAERTAAEAVLRRLVATADRVEGHYPFRHGMGLAAPQIGVRRRIAIVRTTPFAEPIVLIDPRILESGPDTPEPIYEGCLSFFDVRGPLYRPQWIVVEHRTLDGGRREDRFDGGPAALVAHEIDHLDGILYDARMSPAGRLLPVEEYRALQRAQHHAGR